MKARLQECGVLADMLYRLGIAFAHMCRGQIVTDPPRAAKVRTDTIRADQIGVEGKNFSLRDYPWSAFLKPWVSAGAGGKQSCFDPLAATLDVLGMEYGLSLIHI